MRINIPLLLAVLLALALFTSLIGYTFAQDDAMALPDARVVEISAADGLTLVGDFYAASDAQLPTVLLLHSADADRSSWSESLDAVWQSGRNALAVDLRGYGDTGGDVDWQAAVSDAESWLTWLVEQPEVQANAISIIGGGVGANLGAVACENNATCVIAIVLSPVAMGLRGT